MNYTVEDIRDILDEVHAEAARAAQEQLSKQGSDWDACGFGWVNIYKHNGRKLDGRSKLARTLSAAGVRQDYTRAFSIWNPGGYGGQSVSIKEAAARAAANVLRKYGFEAYAGSRLD